MGKQERAAAESAAYSESVMSFLSEEAQAAVNEQGFNLLRDNGFNVDGAENSEKARERLVAEMKKRRASLRYFAVPIETDRSNVIYFELVVNGRVRAKSKGVKVSYRNPKGDEEREEDSRDT